MMERFITMGSLCRIPVGWSDREKSREREKKAGNRGGSSRRKEGDEVAGSRGEEPRESGGGVREEANVQYRRQSRPCAGSSVPEVGRAEAVKHESGVASGGKSTGD